MFMIFFQLTLGKEFGNLMDFISSQLQAFLFVNVLKFDRSTRQRHDPEVHAQYLTQNLLQN